MSEKRRSKTEADSGDGLPTSGIRSLLSIWIPIHLFALLVSYTSVVEPSGLQRQMGQLLQPYLRLPHFGADDRPVYLTHGEPLEQAHRLQVTSSSKDPRTLRDEDWRTVRLTGRVTPGLAASDRIARYLSTVALLSGNEQPSLVAELLMPIAAQKTEVTAIRVIRLPTDLTEINTGITTVYEARVVRRGDQVSLVQLREQRLSSEAQALTSTPSDSGPQSDAGTQSGAGMPSEAAKAEAAEAGDE